MRKPLCKTLLFLTALLAACLLCAAASADAALRYSAYIGAHDGQMHPDRPILLTPENAPEAPVGTVEGVSAVLMDEEGASATWRFTAEEAGLYILTVDYCALPGTSGAVEMSLMLDGEVPYREADQLTLPRLFRDETAMDEAFRQDALGNDLRPRQQEITAWQSRPLFDANGYVADELQFYLSQGEHELTLTLRRETVAISKMTFGQTERVPAYEEYQAQYGVPEKTAGACIIVEAEKPLHKTSTMLYAVSDRSDPATYPAHALNKKLNTIGGANWCDADQTVTYQFDVPADGWYDLSFRYLQNFQRGLSTWRTVQVDGRTLFDDMRRVAFPYDVSWQMADLGDGRSIYLTKGTHTLSMTPTTGEMAPLVDTVTAAVADLNTLYRRIIMVTGVTPDLYRDYYLYESIPGMTEELTRIAGVLRGVSARVFDLTGVNGSEAASLDRLADQLESFAKLPDTIPARLSTFRDNIVSISTWALTIQKQSLQLDRLYICPVGAEMPRTAATLWQSIAYQAQSLIGSFTYDYESVGGAAAGDEQITVWISAGRDQAEVLKDLIDSDFTPQTGIGVQLAVVQSGLMQATMAGKGPDVALMVGHGDAVNYAIRGAVLPLEGYEGFDEVVAQYNPGAMTPYEYDGHYYGLPNSQNFFMMFCRTDVLAELGLTPPQTWDELLAAAETIQRNNMSIGLPYVSLDAYASVSTGIGGTSLFPTLLLQNGMTLYTEDGRTTLDQPGALAAFKTWSNYYTQYGFPLYKDDFNRFRTGEMPIVIANYTFYNQLDTAAPEIRNLWEMTLIPGTVRENGSISRATAASGTAAMILSTTEHADAAWQFLRWWNSADAQAQYGLLIENVLGAAGRYNPANVQALKELPWSSAERQLILAQMAQVVELPELPGSYYVSRNIDNAFKAVYYDHENYREALNYWNRQINDELQRKREEFGIELPRE